MHHRNNTFYTRSRQFDLYSWQLRCRNYSWQVSMVKCDGICSSLFRIYTQLPHLIFTSSISYKTRWSSFLNYLLHNVAPTWDSSPSPWDALGSILIPFKCPYLLQLVSTDGWTWGGNVCHSVDKSFAQHFSHCLGLQIIVWHFHSV